MVEFNVIESTSVVITPELLERIEDDYLYSDMSVQDIRQKYGLGIKEIHNITREIRKEKGLQRRPRYNYSDFKYYYKSGNNFDIRKHIDGKQINFGTIDGNEEDAKKIVEVCKAANWNIEKCFDIVENWREHV